MALQYAILSLLSQDEGSGYDLLKAFEHSVANFWSASHPQIYKELAALERRGMVTHRRVVQQGRPNKKIFRITAEGRAELLRWLRKRHGIEGHNSITTLKAFTLHLLEPEEALAKLEEFREDARAELKHYQGIEKDLAPKAKNGDPVMLASYLSLLFGLNYARGYLRWSEQAAELLRERMARPVRKARTA
jgi:PadR family transcriptional regulator, regulatory protein AphA